MEAEQSTVDTIDAEDGTETQMNSIWQMDGKDIVRTAFYLQENQPAPVFLCELAIGERT